MIDRKLGFVAGCLAVTLAGCGAGDGGTGAASSVGGDIRLASEATTKPLDSTDTTSSSSATASGGTVVPVKSSASTSSSPPASSVTAAAPAPTGAAPVFEQCPVSKPAIATTLAAALTDIRAMPENSWRRVNLNTFASVQQPTSLKPACTSITGPNAIINAWGAFAYDSKRGDLITFGGGHGDYCGNDVYRFRMSTLRWERAGISSQMSVYQAAPDEQRALPSEGLGNSPATAHMYDGLAYIPNSDRMIYFGYGTPSFSGTGAPPLTAALQPGTGPWFFDPARADPGKAVGEDGSAVDPSIRGGYMWQNRQYAANHPGGYLPSNFGPQTASSDTVCEAGKDVIYMRTSGPSSVSSGLIKYVVGSLSDPTQDQLSEVGALSNHVSQAEMAVDTRRLIAVLVGDGARRFAFWDLAASGPGNWLQGVSSLNDLSGGYGLGAGAGMDYDPIRDRLLLWNGESDVWELRIPEAKPIAATGWSVRRIISSGGPAGALLPSSGGANGKWEYARGLDVFVGLREAPNGDVRVYKPSGWGDPAQ